MHVFNSFFQRLSLKIAKIDFFTSHIDPFLNKLLLRVCCSSLLKSCGKRRNSLLRAIPAFPTVFCTLLENFLPFSSNSKLLSANSLSR